MNYSQQIFLLLQSKILFELSTLTLEEFINHRTDYRYEENLVAFLALETDRMQQLLSEYMQFGGYPRIVMAVEQREKLRLIDEIYRFMNCSVKPQCYNPINESQFPLP